MVELKIKDVESLEAIVTALHKNGYHCNSFMHWGKSKVEYFTVQIETIQEPTKITDNTIKALEAIDKQAHGGCGDG